MRRTDRLNWRFVRWRCAGGLGILASCLLAAADALAAERVVVAVHLATDDGKPVFRSSGFLHGFSDDGQVPPDRMATPLRIRLCRTNPAATWMQARRMKALGIQQQVVISDAFGYGKDHPGDGGNWTRWEEFVVKVATDAKKHGVSAQWDIWNEPDHEFFWKRSPEQFLETWKRACLKLREADPRAPIVGPSWSNVHPGEPRFNAFLEFCKANKVVPDYVCWHFPRDVVKEVQTCREFLAKQGIEVKGIHINEYALKAEQYAGKTAFLIAQMERAKVDGACHAVWGDEGKGNLDGILSDPQAGVPRGQWWAYRRYADVTGILVQTEPAPKLDLVAGKDDRQRAVRVLLGNAGGFTGDVTVRFTGLDKVPYVARNGRVHVVVEKVPEENGGAVAALPVLLEKDVVEQGGLSEITFPWSSDRDAYVLHLGASPPQ